MNLSKWFAHWQLDLHHIHHLFCKISRKLQIKPFVALSLPTLSHVYYSMIYCTPWGFITNQISFDPHLYQIYLYFVLTASTRHGAKRSSWRYLSYSHVFFFFFSSLPRCELIIINEVCHVACIICHLYP